MIEVCRAVFVAALISSALVAPTVAQSWTVESIDREQEDATGPGFCILRSSEGLVLSLSPYENANYVGFTGRSAEGLGLRWLPRGPIQQVDALLQVDEGRPTLLNGTLHHVPRPESGGVLVDLYAYYQTASDLVDALGQGARLYVRVAENLTQGSGVRPTAETTLSFSLDGSAEAISKLEQCVIRQPGIPASIPPVK